MNLTDGLQTFPNHISCVVLHIGNSFTGLNGSHSLKLARLSMDTECALSMHVR